MNDEVKKMNHWDDFVEFADRASINLDVPELFESWWECWCEAIVAERNSQRTSKKEMTDAESPICNAVFVDEPECGSGKLCQCGGEGRSCD